MITNPSGYSQYKEQSVNTMTQGEILVLLFEEAVKRLIRAKMFLEKNEITGFEIDITRAREIVQYLQQTLDRKYPISSDLYRLYEYLSFQLSRVLASRKPELIDEILPFFTDLKETWKEADKISRSK